MVFMWVWCVVHGTPRRTAPPAPPPPPPPPPPHFELLPSPLLLIFFSLSFGWVHIAMFGLYLLLHERAKVFFSFLVPTIISLILKVILVSLPHYQLKCSVFYIQATKTTTIIYIAAAAIDQIMFTSLFVALGSLTRISQITVFIISLHLWRNFFIYKLLLLFLYLFIFYALVYYRIKICWNACFFQFSRLCHISLFIYNCIQSKDIGISFLVLTIFCLFLVDHRVKIRHITFFILTAHIHDSLHRQRTEIRVYLMQCKIIIAYYSTSLLSSL